MNFQALVREKVEAQLATTLDSAEESLAKIAPELREAVGTLRSFLVGGKYLRPQCVAIGALAAHGELDESTWEAVARFGAAIELLQASALIHDDVIDHSPLRRGRDAVHVAHMKRHSQSNLAGDSAEFGVAMAVILGDLALVLADDLAATTHAPDATHEQWHAVKREVMAGQFLDISHQAGAFVSATDPESAALTVIRWKTVSYTFLRPLLIGATLAGASEKLAAALSDFALATGNAFQLRDDILGVFGDPNAIGKPASGDLMEGKRTALIAFAEAHGNAQEREALLAALGNPNATAEDLAGARSALETSGAYAHVMGMIDAEVDRARAAISECSSAGASPEAVTELAGILGLATGA